MLEWALIFFVISIAAGIPGFTGIASGAARIARMLFDEAIAVFPLFLVLGPIAGEQSERGGTASPARTGDP